MAPLMSSKILETTQMPINKITLDIQANKGKLYGSTDEETLDACMRMDELLVEIMLNTILMSTSQENIHKSIYLKFKII